MRPSAGPRAPVAVGIVEATGRPLVTAALFATVAVCWGSTFLWVHIATRGTSPLVVVEVRLLVGAAVVLGVARLRDAGASWSSLKGWLGRGLLLALTTAAIPNLLLAVAERGITSGTAAILNATAPLMAVLYILPIASLRRASGVASPAGATGLVLGAIGVAAFVGATPSGRLSDELLMVLCSVIYSGSGIYAQIVFAAAPPFAAALLTTVLGASAMLPLGIVGWVAHPPDGGALLASVAAGAISTGLAYMAYFALLDRIGAARTLSVMYVTPCVALGLGVALIGERVAFSQLAAFALIMFAIAVLHGHLGRSLDRLRARAGRVARSR